MEIIDEKIKGCTYVKVIDFVNSAQAYLKAKDNKNERSQLTYALTKLSKKYEPHVEKFNEKVRDKRVALASKEKDSENLVEREFFKGTPQAQTRYAYTPDAQKRLDDAIRNVGNEVITDSLEKHWVDVPASIDPAYLDVFTPFVFAPMTEAQEMEWYLNSQPKKIQVSDN
jgi:hypothetical protein